MAIIISADKLKEAIPGYNPLQSHLVHAESAKMADAFYARAVKESDLNTVVLLSGGTASGKTEFVSEYLADKPYIIVDGTLPTLEGAQIKIRSAKKRGKML